MVFLRGAEASASPSFALLMFITIQKIIILHLFLGVPAATVGGTGTPWHTRGYAPGLNDLFSSLPHALSRLKQAVLTQSCNRKFKNIKSIERSGPRPVPGGMPVPRHN